MTDCIFCQQITEEYVLYQTSAFRVIFDIDPIQTGHLLIISKEHYDSMTDLPLAHLHELSELQAHLIRILEEQLPIDGVTSASNDASLMSAGTHFHVHLIPRLAGDGFWNPLDLPKEAWDLQPFLAQLPKDKPKGKD